MRKKGKKNFEKKKSEKHQKERTRKRTNEQKNGRENVQTNRRTDEQTKMALLRLHYQLTRRDVSGIETSQIIELNLTAKLLKLKSSN